MVRQHYSNMPGMLADVVGEHTGIELPTSNYLMGIPLEPAATVIVEAGPGTWEQRTYISMSCMVRE